MNCLAYSNSDDLYFNDLIILIKVGGILRVECRF